MVYSYGSGALATMFEFRVRKPTFQKKFTVEKIASVVDLSNRLAERETVTPEVKETQSIIVVYSRCDRKFSPDLRPY